MIALPALQGEFQDFLLDRPNDLAAWVKPGSKADTADLLNIYHNAYAARLIEVLGNDYPALKAMIGEKAFGAMARAYIAAIPSRHPSARWVGSSLAVFLAETAPYATNPALGEMAAFEWAQAGAFDAADIDAMTFEQMAAIPVETWPGLRFHLAPTLRRLSLSHDVPAIWLAVNEKQAGEPPVRAEPRQCEWLVWRSGLEVRFRPLEEDEAWALDEAAQGGDFAALCEGLCRWAEPDRAALRAAELIKGWLDSALIQDAWVENLTLA